MTMKRNLNEGFHSSVNKLVIVKVCKEYVSTIMAHYIHPNLFISPHFGSRFVKEKVNSISFLVAVKNVWAVDLSLSLFFFYILFFYYRSRNTN